MYLKSVFLLVCMFVAGCSTAPETTRGEVVPLKRILSEMRDKPYECFEYKARNDTCSAIAKRSVSGDTLRMEVEFLQFLRGRGTVTVHIDSSFKMGETSFCGRLADADIRAESTVIPPHIIDEILEDVKRRFERDGLQCNEYLLDSEGQFFSRSKDASGRVTGPADRVWFFSEPKRLSG